MIKWQSSSDLVDQIEASQSIVGKLEEFDLQRPRGTASMDFRARAFVCVCVCVCVCVVVCLYVHVCLSVHTYMCVRYGDLRSGGRQQLLLRRHMP